MFGLFPSLGQNFMSKVSGRGNGVSPELEAISGDEKKGGM